MFSLCHFALCQQAISRGPFVDGPLIQTFDKSPPTQSHTRSLARNTLSLPDFLIAVSWYSSPPFTVRHIFQDPQWLPETTDSTEPSILGGAKVGLQLFIWRVIQALINNNTRINFVFCILTTKNLLLPNPIYVIQVHTYLQQSLIYKLGRTRD